jgi:hypothetical protein
MPHSPDARIAPSSLHRPRIAGRGPLALRRNLARSAKPFRSSHRLDPWIRRRRFLVEGVVTLLATTFLTSLALAHPAVLRNDPGTTLQAVGSQLLPGLVASPTSMLHDCP